MTQHISHHLQGTLDGLCSIYAAVNCLTRLAPLDDADLFEVLIAGLGPYLPLAIGRGLTACELKRLVLAPAKQFCASKGYRLHYAAIPAGRLDAMWQIMRKHCNAHGEGSILLAMETHWTCVQSISPRCIRLLDSEGLTRLYRAHLTIGVPSGNRRYYIEPTQTFLLRAEKRACVRHTSPSSKRKGR